MSNPKALSIVYGVMSKFLIGLGLHKCSTLSLLLIALAIDKTTANVQNKVLQCMLFADNMVLIS